MTLLSSQVYPVFADNQKTETSKNTMFPDNVTIEQPVALEDIHLPENEYGKLSWVNGTFVPDRRVQSCKVALTPAEGVDLSDLEGWDEEEGVLYGSIAVIVSSIEDTGDSAQASQETTEGEAEVTVTPGISGSDVAALEVENSVENPQAADADSSGETQETDADTQNENESALDTADTPKEETEEVTEATIEVTPEITEEATNEETTETAAEEADAGENKEEEMLPAENSETVSEDETSEADAVGQEESEEPKESEESKENPDNIFDCSVDSLLTKDQRPVTIEENPTEEQIEMLAQENHTSAGISVSGIDLPWYVQFRVSSGDSYQFTNEEDAAIFQSFEFELWDLQNDTEYEIPDGEYISVTVPVKEGYEYTIEHILDNGAMETIIPSVDGDTMVFSTHSFSPFGIAGSKPIVGSDIAEAGYGDDSDSTGNVSSTPTADQNGSTEKNSSQVTAQENSSSSNDAASGGTAVGSTGSTDNTDNDTGNTNTKNTDTKTSNTDSKSVSGNTVNTGDTTNIAPFVILVVAAAAIIVAVVVIKKKKK
jgi:hypothetical protein